MKELPILWHFSSVLQSFLRIVICVLWWSIIMLMLKRSDIVEPLSLLSSFSFFIWLSHQVGIHFSFCKEKHVKNLDFLIFLFGLLWDSKSLSWRNYHDFYEKAPWFLQEFTMISPTIDFQQITPSSNSWWKMFTKWRWFLWASRMCQLHIVVNSKMENRGFRA